VVKGNGDGVHPEIKNVPDSVLKIVAVVVKRRVTVAPKLLRKPKKSLA